MQTRSVDNVTRVMCGHDRGQRNEVHRMPHTKDHVSMHGLDTAKHQHTLGRCCLVRLVVCPCCILGLASSLLGLLLAVLLQRVLSARHARGTANVLLALTLHRCIILVLALASSFALCCCACCLSVSLSARLSAALEGECESAYT